MRTASIVLSFALLAASVTGAQPRGSGKKSGAIILGGLFNLTGAQAALDVPTYRGARLAVGEIDAGGGLLGREVGLVAEDGKSRPEKLKKDAEKILPTPLISPTISSGGPKSPSCASAPSSPAGCSCRSR